MINNITKISIYHSVLAVQIKNWEPLVFGPEFAIEGVPAETENPASKLINCGAVNKVLTRFYQQHSNGSA